MVTEASLRQRVFKALDKNPLLTAKSLGKVLELSIDLQDYYKGYFKKLKSEWKCHHIKEQGSICSCPDDVHNVFYRGVLPKVVGDFIRKNLFEVWERAGWDRWAYPERFDSQTGWRLTRSKNKYLLYKSSLGRIRLFQTGTVEIFVRKPANLGKCKQLFSDAFTRHYLVSDLKVIDGFFAGLMRRFHATYKTGQRMPYMKITTFEDTHRLTFVTGDRTHPDCVEIIAEYHAEVEQARRLFDEIRLGFGSNGSEGVGPKPLGKMDYST